MSGWLWSTHLGCKRRGGSRVRAIRLGLSSRSIGHRRLTAAAAARTHGVWVRWGGSGGLDVCCADVWVEVMRRRPGAACRSVACLRDSAPLPSQTVPPGRGPPRRPRLSRASRRMASHPTQVGASHGADVPLESWPVSWSSGVSPVPTRGVAAVARVGVEGTGGPTPVATPPRQ